MTDNFNVKAGIAVDNGKMAAHAGHSDAKGSTQSTHKDVSADPKFNTQNKNNDTGMKAQNASGHEQSGSHKDVSAR
jgi:hypothetical protein